MPIDFTKARWDKIKEDYGRWWAGELKRPLIRISTWNRSADKAEPRVKDSCKLLYDLSVSAEEIVEMWDWQLGGVKFHGDAFPSAWPNMGPGVIAAFIGGKPVPAEDTVWFEPSSPQEIKNIHLKFDPTNAWFKRCLELSQTAVEKWQGQVQVGMTDLGGNLDIVSTFRPSEQLPMDLYDNPAEVKRLGWEAHDAWWACFEEIHKAIAPRNPGYSAWLDLYSEVPYYVLQCDFCYMIGPDMFDEFVKPELAASAKRLGNAYYHLDGVGQLPHLDSLLSIKEIKGIQWVFGDGKPGMAHWPEVYKKIRAAGKTIYVYGTMKDFDTLVGQLGSAEGIVFSLWREKGSQSEIKEFLAKYKWA
jgi:hypothetical protein